MNEEMEYAEMLEIPVSTVNVVRKKSKRKQSKGLQESLISQVNEKIERDKRDFSLVEEAEQIKKDYEGVETVLLEQPASPARAKSSTGSKILAVEFALSCALCGGIFLTNVFMPHSAINTFFRSIGNEKEEKVAEKIYTDFALESALGDSSQAELTVSPAGVMSFTNKGHVYPVADGTVSAVTKNADGSYEITIGYTSEFCGVISGLTNAYYQVGDQVKANIPVGYSDGEGQVSVSLYADGELLNCFTLNGDRLTWLESEQ